MKKLVTRWKAQWMDSYGEAQAELVVVSLEFELQPTRLKITKQSGKDAYKLRQYRSIFDLNYGYETKKEALQAAVVDTVQSIESTEAELVEYKRRLAELAKALPGDVD